MPNSLIRFASLAVLLWPGPVVGHAGNSEPAVKLESVQVQMIEDHPGSVVVDGDVRKRGLQMLLDGKVLTLTQAVLNAGPTEWADMRKIKLRHRNLNGPEDVSNIDVEKILEAGEGRDDRVLQNGDRIIVPRRGHGF